MANEIVGFGGLNLFQGWWSSLLKLYNLGMYINNLVIYYINIYNIMPNDVLL